MDSTNEDYYIANKDWWEKRRFRYNVGLVLAGITAFALYAILGLNLIAPHDNEFEINLFTILIQGTGYLFMMMVANILYFFGHIIDIRYNEKHDEQYSKRLFNLGFWFSFSLPFVIPFMIVIMYFREFA